MQRLAVLAPIIAVLAYGARTASAPVALIDPPIQHGTINLTIGSADDDRPEYQFGYVSGLTMDAKGQIYIADAKENKVRVFSDKGIHLFSIGQKGAGPGDFAGPGNISIANDGALWVREGSNHRYSVIRPEPPRGKLVRVVAMNSNSGTMDRTHWDAQGRLVVIDAVATKPGDPFRSLRLFMNDKGSVVASDTAPPISPDSAERWVIRANGGVANYSKPFGMDRISAFGGNGLAAFATNTVYAVSLVDAHGKRIALLKRQIAPVKPSSREVKQIEDRVEKMAKDNKVTVSSLNLDIPKTKPIIASLGFDIDGRVWVNHNVADGTPHEADMYAPNGKWIATMQWPAAVTLDHTAVKGNTGLGITVDADGGQHVVRLTWK